MRRTALAAFLAVVGGGAGCCACATSPTFTVREGAARAPGPEPSLATSVRVAHFADFGDATCQRSAVAAAIAAAHRRAPFAAAVVPGDNIYECGPDALLAGANACAFAPDGNAAAPGYAPPNDPAFSWAHERALAPLAGIPVWLALGNHDVAGAGRCAVPGLDPAAASRRKACLEVAHRSAVWSMPARHYAVDLGPARFIVVDSNLAIADYGGFSLDDEVAFVASAAAPCDADDPAVRKTCFLVGHHAPASAGGHRATLDAFHVARFGRIVAAGGGRIRAWLAGHDHDLQHLRSGNLDVLVSGNTSRMRPLERFSAVAGDRAHLLFASVSWGYGVLEVGEGGWRYRFESDAGAPLYCCAAIGAGRCEPTACR